MERLSVQGLIQGNVTAFLSQTSLPLFHHKAIESLATCRTAALGGHTQYCENGHLNGVWYNSCKHRACPQCRNLAKEEWIQNTQRLLLDCPHHHVVFTLPSELNSLWQFNRERLMDRLFQAVKDTLKTFSDDPRYLDATPGIISTLHTWGRNLCLHPHLHVLISHGGLNKQGDWVQPRKQHLFPQKPVMMVYRGKLLEALKQDLQKQRLHLPDDMTPSRAQSMLNFLGRKSWVVHFSERYDHARGVANYLGRYVKGGPLRNNQLRRVSNNRVRFQYKSHKTRRVESMELSLHGFILRLLQHVPIPSKPSVRYGGLYVSSNRSRLNVARAQLGQIAVPSRIDLPWDTFMTSKGAQPVCEHCGSPLQHRDKVNAKYIAV